MGGMEKHIYNLSNEENKLGHEVTVFFNKGSKVSHRDVKITKLPLHSTKPRALGILIFYMLIVIKLLFKKEKFDIVHIHGDWSSLLCSKIIQKLTNSKILAFSIHDDIKNNYLYKHIFALLLKQVDIIFSTGFQAGENIRSLTSKGVYVHPSGINKIFLESDSIKRSSSTFQIITVANLVAKKNLDLILDIAKELKEITFIIAGDGKERIKLQTRINSENIDNLILVGYKTPMELKELYRQSNLFLLTSFFEGTPTVILEAMASGLPIVCSEAGGINNIVPNYCDLRIVTGFVKEKYIKILIEYKVNFEKYTSKKNIQFANEYDWKKVALKITSQLSRELLK